jgi:hypothetical protein
MSKNPNDKTGIPEGTIAKAKAMLEENANVKTSEENVEARRLTPDKLEPFQTKTPKVPDITPVKQTPTKVDKVEREINLPTIDSPPENDSESSDDESPKNSPKKVAGIENLNFSPPKKYAKQKRMSVESPPSLNNFIEVQVPSEDKLTNLPKKQKLWPILNPNQTEELNQRLPKGYEFSSTGELYAQNGHTVNDDQLDEISKIAIEFQKKIPPRKLFLKKENENADIPVLENKETKEAKNKEIEKNDALKELNKSPLGTDNVVPILNEIDIEKPAKTNEEKVEEEEEENTNKIVAVPKGKNDTATAVKDSKPAEKNENADIPVLENKETEEANKKELEKKELEKNEALKKLNNSELGTDNVVPIVNEIDIEKPVKANEEKVEEEEEEENTNKIVAVPKGKNDTAITVKDSKPAEKKVGMTDESSEEDGLYAKGTGDYVAKKAAKYMHDHPNGPRIMIELDPNPEEVPLHFGFYRQKTRQEQLEPYKNQFSKKELYELNIADPSHKGLKNVDFILKDFSQNSPPLTTADLTKLAKEAEKENKPMLIKSISAGGQPMFHMIGYKEQAQDEGWRWTATELDAGKFDKKFLQAEVDFTKKTLNYKDMSRGLHNHILTENAHTQVTTVGNLLYGPKAEATKKIEKNVTIDPPTDQLTIKIANNPEPRLVIHRTAMGIAGDKFTDKDVTEAMRDKSLELIGNLKHVGSPNPFEELLLQTKLDIEPNRKTVLEAIDNTIIKIDEEINKIKDEPEQKEKKTDLETIKKELETIKKAEAPLREEAKKQKEENLTKKEEEENKQPNPTPG